MHLECIWTISALLSKNKLNDHVNQDLEKLCASSASIHLNIFSWLPFTGAVEWVFAVAWALTLGMVLMAET